MDLHEVIARLRAAHPGMDDDTITNMVLAEVLTAEDPEHLLFPVVHPLVLAR